MGADVQPGSGGGTHVETDKNRFARQLFDSIADDYDLLLEVMTLFQNRCWRRFLVSRLRVPPRGQVLDICTGTAGVAILLARTYRPARVVGIDISEMMLRRAELNIRRQGLEDMVELVRGRAESIQYPNDHFDAVAFTYLLRYVEDIPSTLAEVVRVLKPGGRIASLDFAEPERAALRWLWRAYTRGALPLATRYISHGWRKVGEFLGPDISQFYRRHSLDALCAMWRAVGIRDVRAKRLSLGGAVVMWGTKDEG